MMPVVRATSTNAFSLATSACRDTCTLSVAALSNCATCDRVYHPSGKQNNVHRICDGLRMVAWHVSPVVIR